MKKWIILLLLPLMSCNYNFYQGELLEEEGRFEEANIEYHRAYSRDLGNSDYQSAYKRTAQQTVEDLLKRYEGFLFEGRFRIAYSRLEQANNMMPNHPRVVAEMAKWTKILVAGKLELNFDTLKDQLPLAEDMAMVVVVNTPDPNYNMIAEVDVQTNTFSAVDQVYQADIRYLMSYSLNSIGVRLKKKTGHRVRFEKFVDFKKIAITKISGGLAPNSEGITPVESRYPYDILANNIRKAWIPQTGIQAEVVLAEDRIRIAKTKSIDFFPQILYMNQKDKRVFLDYGVLHLEQKTRGGSWFFNRRMDEKRSYLSDLRQRVLLTPFFQFREGAYPLVVAGN